MPWVAPVALGLGSALGGAVGGIYSANKSAEASAANTQKQLAWERERATNAHQWEVQDLQKAGINPVLTAGGSGATTGSISPQMPDTSGYQSAGAAIASGVNTGAQAALTAAEIAKTKAETINTMAETKIIPSKELEILARKNLHEQTSANMSTQNEINKIELELKRKYGEKSIQFQMFRDLATGVAAGTISINQLKNTVQPMLNTSHNLNPGTMTSDEMKRYGIRFP